MSKEILFTNAAVQNGEFTLDEKPFKATGIVSARVLNHLVGVRDSVHVWNDVGLFIDTDVSARDRLAMKYESDFMKTHLGRWSAEGVTEEVISDTDVHFSMWAQDFIETALEKGAISILNEEFTACATCELTIAESAVSIAVCSRCGNSEGLMRKEEHALFVDLPEDRTTLFRANQQFNKSNIKQELSTLSQLHPRLLLSRDRAQGVGLESIGLSGKVLDPRLGIGLLGVYLAARLGYESAGIVQSYSTLVRTVPYINSVIPDVDTFDVPEVKFAFHSKIDPSLFFSEGVSPELLALHALRQKTDVKIQDIVSIEKEQRVLEARAAILHRLARERGVELSLGATVAAELDAGLSEGDLTHLLHRVGKRLGVAIDKTKHHAEVGAVSGRSVAEILALYRMLEPIVR